MNPLGADSLSGGDPLPIISKKTGGEMMDQDSRLMEHLERYTKKYCELKIDLLQLQMKKFANTDSEKQFYESYIQDVRQYEPFDILFIVLGMKNKEIEDQIYQLSILDKEVITNES